MTTIQERHPYLLFLQYTLTILCALGTVLLIGCLLKYSSYGIDFTDESFYLVWMANPFIYEGSASQFGFIYHPLYILLGGDIASLRRANILITFGLAWSLTYFFLASLAPELKKNRLTLLTIAAGLATSSFILFATWLPTPSYNSLSLQALMICTIGLTFAERDFCFKSTIGWILISFGGWLAFMAKPSTAFALAAAVFIYLLLARKFSIRMVALAVGCVLALLLVSALVIDSSVPRFVERLQLGIKYTRLIGGGHSLSHALRIDDFQLDERFKHLIGLSSVTLFVAIWSLWKKNKKWSLIGLLISIICFAITATLTLGQIQGTAKLGDFQALQIFGVIYAVAFAALILGRLKALKIVLPSQWIVAALFLVMPHIYAFGTNGIYWQVGGQAAIFWLLAGLTLLSPLIRERASWLIALPPAIFVQAITATLLQTGLEQPYRQPQPLRLNSVELKISPQGLPLLLSQGYADYISSAVSVSQGSGFRAGTPVIDLSGMSPGILYAMGAKSIGQAWMIGGYPGSLSRAFAALNEVECEEIASAWILLEPEGPRSISSELLIEHGIRFPNGYRLVGRWLSPEGAGGQLKKREQFLYVPLTVQANADACRIKRNK